MLWGKKKKVTGLEKPMKQKRKDLYGKNSMNKRPGRYKRMAYEIIEDSVESRTTSEILGQILPPAHPMWPLTLSTSYLHTAPSFLLEPESFSPLLWPTPHALNFTEQPKERSTWELNCCITAKTMKIVAEELKLLQQQEKKIKHMLHSKHSWCYRYGNMQGRCSLSV